MGCKKTRGLQGVAEYSDARIIFWPGRQIVQHFGIDLNGYMPAMRVRNGSPDQPGYNFIGAGCFGR